MCIFVSPFLRLSGERVIRRSPSPSPMLTVSLTNSSLENRRVKPPVASVDVDQRFVERVGVVLGEELGDELSPAVDTDLLEHRLDVVADGVR